MLCQDFENPNTQRPLGRRRWNSASIFCGSRDTTSEKRNFEMTQNFSYVPWHQPTKTVLHHLIQLVSSFCKFHMSRSYTCRNHLTYAP